MTLTNFSEICMVYNLFSFLGTDEVYKSSWFAFESMKFLWDKNKPRSTLSTVSNFYILQYDMYLNDGILTFKLKLKLN